MKSYRIILALLMPLMFTACAKDLVTGKKELNFYKIESEEKIGTKVLNAQLKAAKKKEKEVDKEADAKEYKRLQKIVKQIQPHTHYPDFPYEIHIMQSDVVNAWCAPGGKMMVYTGLWDDEKGLVEKGNDDELAAVVAHEMAHANARHVTEAVSQSVTILMAGTAAQTAISAGGLTQGANIFGQVFSDGVSIYLPSYSRGNEYEADKLGIMYMAKAGYDPNAAVELWKKAAKKKKDKSSIYASHPSSGARAKALEKYLPEAEYEYKTATNQH
ncbi:MAG: M48 family metallopeptidase [Deltaproteobacteria bacterium]|jgi:metalloendopeptidase OMA1, mitochondrial|nr:M48 family metallopeptidase [Deltaproteobacteria bacterium]